MNKKEISNLIDDYRIYAQENNLKLNPDQRIVEVLVNKILENEKKYGKRYCPCYFISNNCEDCENKKRICPCHFLKQEVEKNNQCHCGLFIKNEKD